MSSAWYSLHRRKDVGRKGGGGGGRGYTQGQGGTCDDLLLAYVEGWSLVGRDGGL